MRNPFEPAVASGRVLISRLRGSNRRSVSGSGRRAVYCSVLIVAASLSPAAAPIALATHYDNTNPGATPCGDGSNPVQNVRTFYIKSNGLAYARLEMRWSKFCNTVWIRAVNVTGSGAGYAPEQRLVSDERLLVYDCPRVECLKFDRTEVDDVLPGKGSAGWSKQFTLPPNGSLGVPAAPQPPTIRGRVVITTAAGVNLPVFDTALEPMWTWYANNFANERNLRDPGDKVFSCTNDPDRCVTQRDAVVWYELDASLNNTPGAADLMADMKNVILPGWSGAGDAPTLTWCGAGCADDVLVKVVPVGDPNLGNNLAVTLRDGGFTAGEPAFFNHQTILVRNMEFNHPCGAVDDGCNVGGDDRPLISHEVGHTLGLGHCDLDYSVMCHVRSTLNSELAEGTTYWTPQTRDLRAINALY